MAQESRLAIVIDSSGAKSRAEELAKAMEALEAAGVRVTNSNADVSASMGRMASESDKAAASIKRGLAAVLGGLSAMAVIDIADEWGQYASRIRMATESAEEYEYVQTRMAQSAQVTFRAINETRESFIQMSPVLRDMGLSLEQSIDAIDAFSGLLVVNGANAQRGAIAMEALAKSLQRGKVDGREWMTIYSTVDSIVDLLAESMGKTANEVRRLGLDGKISAEMIATALVGGSDKVIKAVEGMPTSVRDAMQNINTAFVEYIGKSNEAHGVTAAFASGLGLLGGNLDSVLNVAIAAAGIGLTAYTAKTTLSLVETGKLTAAKIAESAASRNGAIAAEIFAKARLAEAQATVASATGMRRLTLVQTELIPAQRQLESATRAVAAANRGLGATMLGLVGGPVGAITIAAGLAATAFFALKSSTDDSREAFDDFGKSVEDLTEKWRQLTAAQNEALRGQYTLAENQAEKALEIAKKELDSALALMGEGFKGSSEQLREFVKNINEAEGDTTALVAVLRQAESAGILDPDAAQSVIDYAGSLDGAEKSHTKATSVLKEHLQFMKEFSFEADAAAGSAGLLSGEVASLSEADFSKLISGLQQSLDVIGMSSQQAAEYKARLQGANEEQARQAGFWANLIDIAQKLEGATKEKDATAIKGAQDLLGKLAEQEVQLRMNMVRAAEYATLIAMGIEATIAAQGADTAAQLEGLKAQEDIVARIKSITSNISTNTVPSLKKTGDAAKKLSGEIDDLIGSIFPAIKAKKDWVKQQGLLDQALKKGKLTQEQHAKALVKITEQYELIAFEAPKHVKALQEEAKSLKDSLPSLTQRVETFGLAASAIIKKAEAETRANLVTARSTLAIEKAKGASIERVKQIEQEIKALDELAQYQAKAAEQTEQYEKLEAEKKFNEDFLREWSTTVDKYGDVFRDGFALMLNKGGSDWDSWTKSLLTTFKTSVADQLYKLLAQPLIAKIGLGLGGVLGMGGAATAATGSESGASALGGLGSMAWLTNFGGSVVDTTYNLGMKLMSMDGIMRDFGGTLLENAATIGQVADFAGNVLGYGSSLYQLSQGNWGAGLGGAAGQFFGGPIGSFLGSQLGSIIDNALKGEKRFGGGFHLNPLEGKTTFGDGPSGGYGGTETLSAVDALLKAQYNTIKSVIDGVGAQNIEIASILGSFESSDKGRGGTSSGGQIIIDGQAQYFGSINDQGHLVKGQGYGGTSGSAEEMFANLQSEVHFSALEAWKAVGDQMPTMIRDMLDGIDIRALSAEQAQGLVEQITVTTGQVNQLINALDNLPLESLKGLSFDLAGSLAQAAGGIELFDAGAASFYQGFYSEEEKRQHLMKQYESQVKGLGLSVADTRETHREMIEALDATDEANHKMIAGLLNLSSVADQYYTILEEQADAAISKAQESSRAVFDAASEIARSFTSITNSIHGSIGSLYERIQLDMMADDAEKYDYYKGLFDTYANLLNTSTDANQINDLVNKMTSAASSAYNLLDADVRQGGKGQEYLDTLTQTQVIADRQLEAAMMKQAELQAEQMGVALEKVVKAVVAELNKSGDKMVGAGGAMTDAAQDISGAAQELSYALGTLMMGKYSEVGS